MNYQDIKDLDTLRKVASDPETDPGLLMTIYGMNRPCMEIVKRVIENPSCPSDLLTGFVENFATLAKEEKVPSEYLCIALQHSNCPPAVIGRCLDQVFMDALGFLETAKQAFVIMSACALALRREPTPFKEGRMNELESDLEDVDLTLESIQSCIAEMR